MTETRPALLAEDPERHSDDWNFGDIRNTGTSFGRTGNGKGTGNYLIGTTPSYGRKFRKNTLMPDVTHPHLSTNKLNKLPQTNACLQNYVGEKYVKMGPSRAQRRHRNGGSNKKKPRNGPEKRHNRRGVGVALLCSSVLRVFSTVIYSPHLLSPFAKRFCPPHLVNLILQFKPGKNQEIYAKSVAIDDEPRSLSARAAILRMLKEDQDPENQQYTSLFRNRQLEMKSPLVNRKMN